MSTLTRMKTSRYSRHWDILLGDNADIYLRLWLRHVVMERAEWVTTGSSLGGIHRTIRHNAAVITHCIGYRTWATAQPTRLIPDDYAHPSPDSDSCVMRFLHCMCCVMFCGSSSVYREGVCYNITDDRSPARAPGPCRPTHHIPYRA